MTWDGRILAKSQNYGQRSVEGGHPTRCTDTAGCDWLKTDRQVMRWSESDLALSRSLALSLILNNQVDPCVRTARHAGSLCFFPSSKVYHNTALNDDDDQMFLSIGQGGINDHT